MAEGLKLSFPGGYDVTVVPRDTSRPAQLSVGDTVVTISTRDDGYDVDIRTKISRGAAANIQGVQAEVVDVDGDSIKANTSNEVREEGLLRTCINCQGRPYCVTNACANTPCGWICD